MVQPGETWWSLVELAWWNLVEPGSMVKPGGTWWKHSRSKISLPIYHLTADLTFHCRHNASLTSIISTAELLSTSLVDLGKASCVLIESGGTWWSRVDLGGDEWSRVETLPMSYLTAAPSSH